MGESTRILTSWPVVRNLVLAGLAIILSVYSFDKYTEAKIERFRYETSPCGTKLILGDYLLGDYYPYAEERSRDYFDFGSTVWKIELLDKFPSEKSEQEKGPPVKWKKVMERSPEACADWVRKTGIDFRR